MNIISNIDDMKLNNARKLKTNHFNNDFITKHKHPELLQFNQLFVPYLRRFHCANLHAIFKGILLFIEEDIQSMKINSLIINTYGFIILENSFNLSTTTEKESKQTLTVLK